MKVAPKIVFLFRDPDGFGEAITDALQSTPNSSLRRQDESFDFSLEHYNIKDRKASGNIIHFIDENDVFQVSVLILESHEPPTLVCAISEVLSQLTEGKDSSTMPTIVAPFLVSPSKLKYDSNRSSRPSINKASLHGVQVGPETNTTRALAAKIQKPPPSLSIHYEPLSCFLQLVCVFKLPTIILIGQRNPEELQILYEIGEVLTSFSCLQFAKDKITWNPAKASKDSKEPWRALYG